MEKFDLLTLGEVLLRLSPKENKRIVRSTEFESHVGGAELNVASGVSLLGLHTGIISKLPANAIGELARSKVRSMNVSDDYLVWDHTEDARLDHTFMKVQHFHVNHRWYTIENTVPLQEFRLMNSRKKCIHQPAVFMYLVLPWHFARKQEHVRLK